MSNIGYTKSKQIGKTKTNNKKLGHVQYHEYVDFLRDHSGEMCQNPECSNSGDDVHHAMYGAGGRDDRSMTIICRECHHAIHHGRDTDKASRLKLMFREIGEENWRLYNDKACTTDILP